MCGLLAHSTWAWWWGCHLRPSRRPFSARVVSPSLCRSLFSTRQWFLLYWPQEGGLPLSLTSPYRRSAPPTLPVRTSPYPGNGPLHGTTSRASKLTFMEHLNTEVPSSIQNLYHNCGTGSSETWPTGRSNNGDISQLTLGSQHISSFVYCCRVHLLLRIILSSMFERNSFTSGSS